MATAIRTSPKPPVSVTATAVITSTANATAHLRVEWPAPPTQPQPVSALNLYRNGVLLGTLPSSTRSYTDAVAVAGVSYSYAVTVVSITTSESPPRSSASAPRMPRRPLWAANTPTSRTMAQGDQFSFAGYGSHQDGLAVTYGLVSPPTGYSMTSGGVLTSGGASSTLTLRLTASNGLYADHTFAVTVSQTGSAATYVIPASTSARTLNGGSASGWSAFGPARAPTGGDVIELAPGTHGPLKLQNLAGLSNASRITVRNGNGLVTVRRGSASSGGFVLEYSGCSYVTFDGTNGGQQYGLKVTSPIEADAPTAYIKGSGINRGITWRGFEVDGLRTSFINDSTPVGFHMHDNAVLRSSNPGVFQQRDILVENFKIHRVPGEGIYGGPNFLAAGACPLRDIEIRSGIIENTGREGVQTKCWFEGANSVHHLTVTDCGRNSDASEAGDLSGISIISGAADVYSNTVVRAGETGIQLLTFTGPASGATFDGFGPYSEFDCDVYNNLVVDSGTAPVPNSEHGITVGAGSGLAKVRPNVYNNTVVGSGGYGVNVGNAAAGFVRNNVLLNNASGAYSLGSGGTTQANNKTSGALAGDYRLTSEDAAVGTLGVDISTTDIEGTSRSGTASKGAYEYG